MIRLVEPETKPKSDESLTQLLMLVDKRLSPNLIHKNVVELSPHYTPPDKSHTDFTVSCEL
jgi:hypothetical protein